MDMCYIWDGINSIFSIEIAFRVEIESEREREREREREQKINLCASVENMCRTQLHS